MGKLLASSRKQKKYIRREVRLVDAMYEFFSKKVKPHFIFKFISTRAHVKPGKEKSVLRALRLLKKKIDRVFDIACTVEEFATEVRAVLKNTRIYRSHAKQHLDAEERAVRLLAHSFEERLRKVNESLSQLYDIVRTDDNHKNIFQLLRHMERELHDLKKMVNKLYHLSDDLPSLRSFVR